MAGCVALATLRVKETLMREVMSVDLQHRLGLLAWTALSRRPESSRALNLMLVYVLPAMSSVARMDSTLRTVSSNVLIQDIQG